MEVKIKHRTRSLADERKMLNQDAEISNLREALTELIEMNGLKTKQLDDHQFEVIKDEVATGDYTDPILFVPPMDITQGKWYYLDDRELPREALCDANQITDFDDRNVFDWVE